MQEDTLRMVVSFATKRVLLTGLRPYQGLCVISYFARSAGLKVVSELYLWVT